MKIYKFLPIDDHLPISRKVYDYIVHKRPDILEISNFWNTLDYIEVLEKIPEIGEYCDTIFPGRKINRIAIISVNPNKNGSTNRGGLNTLHKDTYGSQYRILWPILNCQGTYTRFYDPNGNELIYGRSDDISCPECIYTTVKIENPLIELGFYELTAPIVFDSYIMHAIYPNLQIDGARLTMTIGFDPDLDSSVLE